MRNKILFLSFIFLLYFKVLNAQHPVFQKLTEKDGLPDIEFFSIVEDHKGFIWLASGNGLIRYDGKKFIRFTNPEKIGLAVFGLKLDPEGRVWCNNFSGQFFYVENEKLILFKDYKKESNGQLISFSFYQKNIIINTKSGIFQVDLESNNQQKISKGGHIMEPYYTKDSLITINKNKIFLKTEKSESTLKYDLSNLKTNNYNKWSYYLVNNKKFIHVKNLKNLKVKSKLFYEYKNKLLEIELPKNIQESQIINLYGEANELWFCTYNGVFIYEINSDNILNYKRTYFKNKRVSKVLKDRNNNYWFTTLTDGVYIIPNLYVENFKINDEQKNINAMSRVGKDSLIIGSIKGDIAFLNSKKQLKFLKEKFNSQVYSIAEGKNKVYISLEHSLLVYDKTNKKIYKDFINLKAKDLSIIDNNSLLFASYGSTDIINLESKKDTILKKNRSYTVHYSLEKDKYVGSIDGITKYDNKNNASDILFNNKPIFAIDINETKDSTVWFSTSQNGIIGYKNGKIIKNYSTKNGLLSNQVGKIKGDGNLLWISTNKSLQVLNTKTNEIKNLTKKDGVDSFNITEIIPLKNELFFSSDKGLFKINKEKAFKDHNILNFYFTSIFINDVKVSEKENYKLSSKEKKIQFNFQVNGFLAEDNIVYEYKLENKFSSNNWSLVNDNMNQITFNNLAAGNYILTLRASEKNNKNVFKEKKINLEIKLPFYKQIWFIILIIIIFLLLFRLYLKRRLRKNEEKQKQVIEKERMQKELIASKLETLQSQMNPHFTFNALNSIQNLVLKGKKQDAYNYLTKFSSLLRENLALTTKSFVKFDEEISLIKKYLELEKLRFKDELLYEIIGEKLIEDIEIPTMIIQPFIENAIKHGLLHKIDGVGKIKIEFIQKNNLTCIITDNGIGIEASKEINKKTINYKNSFSTKSISSKLKMLKDYYKTDIGFNYKEVKHGTQVVIKIPYNLSHYEN